MSSPENNGASPPVMKSRFNVLRTTQIAKADVPLLGENNASFDGAANSTHSGRANSNSNSNSQSATVPAAAASSTVSAERTPLSGRATSASLQPPSTGSPSTAAANPGRSPIMSAATTTTMTASVGTPPLAPRTTPVPLITPRYQKKSRTNRAMNMTDSFTDRSANAGQLLRQHATEDMTITNGPQQYHQEVHFHAYDVYRHGKRGIHTRSVGYSSDGDIVMTREDYSEASDVDNSVTRVHTIISEPTVLNPAARRPLTDSELNSKRKLHIRRPRYKKYPGLFAPRNKKLRNRLMNDYFVNEQAMRILHMARERREEGLNDETPEPKKCFQDIPASVLRAFDLADDAQEREMERLGAVLGSPFNNYVQPQRDPDSAEARFQGLNQRLRSELQHALNSEFLTRQIEDLEVSFSEFVAGGPTEEALVYRFRDGYGRLVCHGVAAYYQLVSESREGGADGSNKLTYVQFPRSKKAGVRALNLPLVPLIHVLKGKRSSAPAQHPLSAANTPQQVPEPSPEMPYRTGEDGERVELEPMSPLDLNANVPPLGVELAASAAAATTTTTMTRNGSSSSASSPVDSGSSKDDVVAAATAGERRQALVNPTVARTVKKKLPKGVVLQQYMPELTLRGLLGSVAAQVADATPA